MSDKSTLKGPFIFAGLIVGVIGGGTYLYRTMHLPVPDPVWTRFINTSLILFVAIYAANLIRRIIEAVIRKKETR